MIPFDDIDDRLKALGKDRAWLAEATKRKPDSIRVALAPNSSPKNRSALLQKALSDAIEAEEARVASESGQAENLPPGYSAIFFSDEELDIADRASRLLEAPSLAAFCHDVIQAEARRIIALYGGPKLQADKDSEYWLDLVGGVAAGAQIPSDFREEPIPVSKEYGDDHYALRVYGHSGGPKIPDGSVIVVRRLRQGEYPKKKTVVIYADAYGLSLKELDYRAARAGEEEKANNFGKVAILKSLNPAYPDVQTLDGGRIEAVFVERL